MKLVNSLIAIGALAAAALAPLSAGAMVSADNPMGVTRTASQAQQEAKLKPFWESKEDFCILIIAICIEPDDDEG